jgi:hypothetical protein
MKPLLLFLAIGAAMVLAGCATSNLERVQAYHAARRVGDDRAAAEILAPGVRIWFSTLAGPGEDFGVVGPWAEWDGAFHSVSTYSNYAASGITVTVDVAETSDYYRLLDRAPDHAHVTYTLDEQGRIAAVLYEPFKDPHAPASRWNEFKAWADANAHEEFERVAPGGEIVPGREQARVWRKLLTQWRRDSKLPEVLTPSSAIEPEGKKKPGRE